MSGIIPVVPLSGGISSPQELSGSLRTIEPLRGTISNDLIHKSYNDLVDKPSINAVTLQGDKSFEELGLSDISNQEIDRIIDQNGGLY